MKRLFVIFDGPPSHESGRFIEVEDERGASHGADVGLGWEHVSPFSGPDTWRLGPFLSVAALAELDEAERRLAVAHAGLKRALDFRAGSPEGLAIKDDVRKALIGSGCPAGEWGTVGS